ncbi:UDP-3-O-(3-hydroxymyristoyl)glucosamine N-acyltransferase [Candidatus Vallotia tarda]|uniref:UDP-3-O-(3-hydroxymyristoyl)glucosamine N-acyltransferase n=1 Tax=Candidatus Vallotiella hemipterorum TaxID=1177213 RepID=UPI001C1F4C0F|nr:UDP-3-O-(3-hydroxymyristoyl)glucosamine N-acyltransferase [Candidatus Vallotia tarda]
MSITLTQMTKLYGGIVVGDASAIVVGCAPLESAKSGQITFVTHSKYLSYVGLTHATAVLISQSDLDKLRLQYKITIDSPDRAFIVTQNPYVYFARVAQQFSEAAALPLPVRGIHPSAVVDPAAKIGSNSIIGPHVTIETGAVVGESVRIDAYTFIGHDSVIGNNSHLYPNVTVYHGCQLGERVIVHSGVVIGADGFGFAPNFVKKGDEQTGEWVKIPQVGIVRISSDVEIGANTTIDRGTMTDTVIEQGVKIDNLVQIGHNCQIGAYTVVAGCTGIAGSTTIGQHCMIGGAVGIADHLTLADHIIVTAKSGVSKSLIKPGVYTSAWPAILHRDWNKSVALLRNISKLSARIKRVEAALAAGYALLANASK